MADGPTQALDDDFLMDLASKSQDVGADEGAGAVRIWAKLVSSHPQYPAIDVTDDEVVMGRQSVCSVHLPDPHRLISGKHCRIYKQDGTVFIEDLSSNGTFLNGKKIGKGSSTLIRNGDEIMIVQKHGNEPPLAYIFKDLTRSMKIHNQEKEEGGPDSQYDILKTLGTGNFAAVKLAIKKDCGKKFAIKVIDKKKFIKQTLGRKAKEALMEEVNILRSISHPNIIGIEDVFDTEKTFYIVLELVTGGELMDHIIDCGHFPEEKAKKLFFQMLEAVHYLHERGIVHRDLKPENILFEDKTYQVLKLSDFGLSRNVKEGSIMQTMCGTPQYIAPEILLNTEQKGYSKQVDLWSLGAILYIMLCGNPPFDDTKPLQIFTTAAGRNPLEPIITFHDPIWQSVSEEAKDLICCLLEVDPKKRFNTKQCLSHPWLTGDGMEKLKEEREKEEKLRQKILEDQQKELEQKKAEEEALKRKQDEERIQREVEKRASELLEEEKKKSAEKEKESSEEKKRKREEDSLTRQHSFEFATPVAPVKMSKKAISIDNRPMCQYGKNCYRKNPQHFQEFMHPHIDG